MKNRNFTEEMHHVGKIWGFTAVGVVLLFPIVLALIFQLTPSPTGVLKGLLSVAPIFWTVGVIEVITYVPMLGIGGSYLGFVTGNLANLKVPCVLNSLEITGTKTGTEEGEIVATISSAVSSIVTTLIITIGVILIVPLTPILEKPILAPAFNNILPALFGGLAVVYVSKNWKIAITPMIVMLILFIFVPQINSSTVGLMVPVGAIIALIASRIMYKKGVLGSSTHVSSTETKHEKTTEKENTINQNEEDL